MIDASIALGVKAPQIEDPMNSYAKLMQMQHARQQNQLGMMQMDEYRRGVTEKTNFLNSLREAGDDPLKQQRAYGMAGKLSDWVKMQHEQAQTGELGAKTAGHKVKTAKDTQDFMDAAKRNLSINPSDANVVAWGQDAVIKGFATADQAQAEVNRYLSMTPAQRVAEMRKAGSSVEQLTPKFQTVQTPGGGLRIGSILDGSFTTTETLAPKVGADTAATNARIASEGRLNREQAKALAGDVNKVVASTQVDDNGNVTHYNKFGDVIGDVKLGAGKHSPKGASSVEKKAVAQEVAGYNISRVINAATEIGNILKDDPSSLKPGAMEAAASSMGMSGTANLASNANRQMVRGAQRDIVDALLYLSTGAAFSKDQFEGQLSAYIPQWSDEKATVDNKQKRVLKLINDARTRVGPAWTPQMEQAVGLLNMNAARGVKGKVSGTPPPTPATSSGWGKVEIVKP